jgi:hypothetical protein
MAAYVAQSDVGDQPRRKPSWHSYSLLLHNGINYLASQHAQQREWRAAPPNLGRRDERVGVYRGATTEKVRAVHVLCSAAKG